MGVDWQAFSTCRLRALEAWIYFNWELDTGVFFGFVLFWFWIVFAAWTWAADFLCEALLGGFR